MRRYHSIKSNRIRNKRKRFVRSINPFGFNSSNYNYNKQHPMDCGNTKCAVCSYHKRTGEQKIKYVIEDLRFSEQLQETFGDIGYQQKEVEFWMEREHF